MVVFGQPPWTVAFVTAGCLSFAVGVEKAVSGLPPLGDSSSAPQPEVQSKGNVSKCTWDEHSIILRLEVLTENADPAMLKFSDDGKWIATGSACNKFCPHGRWTADSAQNNLFMEMKEDSEGQQKEMHSEYVTIDGGLSFTKKNGHESKLVVPHGEVCVGNWFSHQFTIELTPAFKDQMRRHKAEKAAASAAKNAKKEADNKPEVEKPRDVSTGLTEKDMKDLLKVKPNTADGSGNSGISLPLAPLDPVADARTQAHSKPHVSASSNDGALSWPVNIGSANHEPIPSIPAPKILSQVANATDKLKQPMVNQTMLATESPCPCTSNSSNGTAAAPLFDCQQDYLNRKVVWSVAKKAWCCATLSMGCPAPDLPLADLPNVPKGNISAMAPPAPVVHKPPTIKLVTYPSPQDGFDCDTSDFCAWKQKKMRYCCDAATGRANCTDMAVSAGLNCTEKQDTWMTSWSECKKNHCCSLPGNYCPPVQVAPAFNCDINDDNKYNDWAPDQREWCCSEKYVGCADTAPAVMQISTPTAPPALVSSVVPESSIGVAIRHGSHVQVMPTAPPPMTMVTHRGSHVLAQFQPPVVQRPQVPLSPEPQAIAAPPQPVMRPASGIPGGIFQKAEVHRRAGRIVNFSSATSSVAVAICAFSVMAAAVFAAIAVIKRSLKFSYTSASEPTEDVEHNPVE